MPDNIRDIPLSDSESEQVFPEPRTLTAINRAGPAQPPSLDSVVPPKTPYDELIPDYKEAQTQGLRGSMFTATQTTPEKAADSIKLADKFGVDPQFAHENMDALKKADTPDFSHLIENYPGVTTFMQKPENAAVSHDDIPSLQKIDQLTRYASGSYLNDLGGATHSGFNDFQRSVITTGVGFGLLDKDAALANLTSLQREKEQIDASAPDYVGAYQKAMQESSNDLQKGTERFSQIGADLQNADVLKALGDYYVGGFKSIGALFDKVETAFTSPRALGYESAAGAVQLAPMFAAGLGAYFSAPIAATASFLGGAPVLVGQWFDKQLREKNLTVEQALNDPQMLSQLRGEALRGGLTEDAVYSLLPLSGGAAGTEAKILSPGLKGTLELVKKKASQYAVGTAKASATMTAAHLAGQTAATGKPDITGALGSLIDNLGPAAVFEAAAVAREAARPRVEVNPGPNDVIAPEPAAPPGEGQIIDVQPLPKLLRSRFPQDPVEAIKNVSRETSEAAHTLQSLQALDEMGQAVNESKTAARVPEKIDELIKASGGTGNVYFQAKDWEKYFVTKGLSPSKEAENLLGDGGKAYQEALDSNGQMAVPMSTYVSKVAPTEHYGPLLNFIKTDPAGMTFSEAEQHAKELPNVVKQIAEEAQTPVSHEAEAKVLAKQIEDQLVAAGRPPEEAKAAAQIAESRMKARSAITGTSPQEAFNKYGLEIGGESKGLAEEPNQILHQAPINAPTFYSRLQKTIEEKMGNSATVDQIRGIVKDLKPEEIQYSGLNGFLEGKTKVSKQELLDHLRENQIQINEVTKGDTEALRQSIDQMEARSEEYETAAREEQAKLESALRAADYSKSDSQNLISSVYTADVEQLDNISRIAKSMFPKVDAAAYIDFARKAKQIRREISRANSAVGENAPKFSHYSLPGGTNYREVLLTLPPSKIDHEAAFIDWANKRYGDKWLDYSDEKMKDVEAHYKADVRAKTNAEVYRSSHFDEPNVIAHMRLDDRVDSEGKKVLFIEEVQSDWHQEGRKKGYKGEPNDSQQKYEAARNEQRELQGKINDATDRVKNENPEAVITSKGAEKIAVTKGYITKEEITRRDELRPEVQRLVQLADSKQVPDAPFKKSWQELALKRIIREAAEKGYDKIAWTTGEQQAERYDLSKSVRKIQYKKNKDGNYSIFVIGSDGELVPTPGENSYSESQLEAFVGKDVTQKIINDQGKKERGVVFKAIEGDNLKVGGEGMKGFYDKILVDAANKLTKKFGGKVEETTIETGEKPSLYQILKDEESGRFRVELDDGKMWGSFKTSAEALREYNDVYEKSGEASGAQKVHSLELTPALKESVLKEGFSLFQGPNEKGPRGQIEFGPYKALIKLGKNADASTFIHEAFHLWTKEFVDDFKSLKNSETQNDRQKQFLEDAKTMADYVGADSVESMTTDQWEKIAESGEEYLREGKAPSTALQKAFARFKTWITYLYRAMRRANVELNDKIRGVFDRMLVAEDQVQNQPEAPFPTEGMTPKQKEDYSSLQAELKNYSENRLRESLMKDLKREQSKDYSMAREMTENRIRDQVNQDPTYRALSILQDGKLPDGSELPAGSFPIKLSKEAIMEQYGPDYVSGLPKGIFDKEFGLDPTLAAEMLGFDNAENFLHSIANAPTKESVIQAATDAEMKARYPQTIDEPQLSEAVLKATHNELRSKMLRMELEHLASEDLPKLKGLIRKVAARVPTDMEVRARAEQIIGDKNIQDIRPHEFNLAEAKSRAESGRLLAKGDIDGAFQAKRQELLNHELYRSAAAAQEFIDKSVTQFKKVAKSDEKLAKSRNVDLVNGARSLLAQYGLGRMKELPMEYLKRGLAYAPDVYETILGLVDPLLSTPKDYKSLTYQEFQDLKNGFDSIWNLSKSEKEILIEGKRLQTDDAIQKMGSELDQIPPAKKKKLVNRTKTAAEKRKFDIEENFARGRIAESLIDQWSRGNIDSALRRFLFNPPNEGAEKYHVASDALQAELKTIADPIRKDLRMGQIHARELNDFTFKDKSELLTAVLHSGNDSNLSKLLRGYGWGDVNEEGILDRSKWDAFIARMQKEGVLKPADYEFAQKVWDLFERLKVEAQKSHHEVYGFYFNEITANPFEAFGKKYRGGYLPAKVDPYENRTAQIRQEKNEFEKIENAWAFPTTGRGFTKNRVEKYAAPLSLDLNLIPSALDWELRFIHIEPRVKDVAKLLWNEQLREKINEIHPYAVHEVLVPWLQRTASQKVTNPGTNKFRDRFFSYMRQSTQAVYLTLNVVSAAKRLSGIFPAFSKVSPYQLGSAFVDYMTTKNLTKSIRERSQFMQAHVSDQLFRIQEAEHEILSSPTIVGKFQDQIRPYQGLLIRIVQHVVDTSVWIAAHNKAIEEAPKGLSIEEIEKRAIRAADSAVRLTQGSGFPEHVSQWATGTAGERLFKMFVQHFNTIGNLLVSETSKADSFAKKILHASYFLAFAASGELIRQILVGGSKEDEKKKWPIVALESAIQGIFGITASAIAPTAGPIAESYMRFLLKDHSNPMDYHIEASPALGASTSGLRGAIELKNSIQQRRKLKGSEIEDLFTLLGLITGVPLSPIAKPISYYQDVKSGRVEKPKNAVDLTRGVVTGRGKSR